MSRAIKCDRCGRCFDPTGIGDDAYIMSFKNPRILDCNPNTKVKVWTVERYLFDDYSPDENIDLCNKCADAMEAFMHGAEIPAIRGKYPYGDTKNTDV